MCPDVRVSAILCSTPTRSNRRSSNNVFTASPRFAASAKNCPKVSTAAPLQRHLFARAAGAVDGVDDFHGLHAFLAGHHRLSAPGDGVAGIQGLAVEGGSEGH